MTTDINSYDAFPYESLAFAQTHPNYIGAIATLCGLSPALPSRARVLEIGCASGGNLIPMALQFPGGRYLGIDLSERQIKDGQREISDLGLDNIALRQLDIMETTASLGEFDYIIAHGVYSWVPELVRQGLLKVCRQNLAPHGVAFVSYNVFPGWNFKQTVREMMLFHVRNLNDPKRKVEQARALIEFLAEHNQGKESAYGLALKEEMEFLKTREDYYLFHEYLEGNNHPVYFTEFVAHFEAAGLAYVADANLSSMNDELVRPQTLEILQRISSNPMHFEQYSDFLSRRTFRQSLLTRAGTNLGWNFSPEIVTRLRFSGQFVESRAGDENGAAIFKSLHGNTHPQFSTAHRLSREALRHLSEHWPQALSFQELLDAGRQEMHGQPPSQDDINALSASLTRLGMLEMASFFLEPWPFTAQISTHPAVSPLARHQSKKGRRLTTQSHFCEQLGNTPLQSEIIAMLNGQNTPADIADKMAHALVAARQQINVHGRQIRDKKGFAAFIHELVMELLPKLARAGLLVK